MPGVGLTSIPPRLIFTTVGRRSIASTSFAGFYYAVALEVSRLRRRGDRRLSLVHRSALLRIGMSFLHVLGLSRDCRNMPLFGRSLLFRSRTRRDSPIAAVEADAVHSCVVDCRVVDVVNVFN